MVLTAKVTKTPKRTIRAINDLGIVKTLTTAKSDTTNPATVSTLEGHKIYSPKLGRYIPIVSKPKGNAQKYNIGMGPGNWY
jgi:hypothetical protein